VQDLESWVLQVKDKADENCVIFLVGCKSDLIDPAELSQCRTQIMRFVDQMNLLYFDDSIFIDNSHQDLNQSHDNLTRDKKLKFFSTSAKEDPESVFGVFQEMANTLYAIAHVKNDSALNMQRSNLQ
jgi:GTPase SAR1 family protein